MAESRYGIELDGSHATLVEVLARQAVAATTFTGPSPSDALNQALASLPPKRKNTPVRVALVSSSTSMRRLDVTVEALSNRTVFEEVAYKSVASREGTAVAGLFFDSSALIGEALGSGVAVIAPSEPVDDAYRALSKVSGEVVPPAFTLAGSSGLHLAVRRTNADLTLVVNGRPVQHRQLRTGGLAALATSVDEINGAARLEALITRSGSPDPLAAAELDRYLRALAAEVRRTADHWGASGEDLPETIHVFGTGGRIRDLDDHLADVGLARTVDENLVRAMAYIPMGAREAATGAFFAAVTQGMGMPQAAFPSTVVIERAAARAASKRRQKLLAAAAAAVAIPLAVYFGPVTKAQYDLNQAQDAQATAQARVNALTEERQVLDRIAGLRDQYLSLTSTDPRWAQVLEITYGTAASSGVGVSTLTADVDEEANVVVTASGESSGQDYTALTGWINTLTSEFEAFNTSAPRFATSGDVATFQINFTIPADRVSDERPVPGEED